jgi:hypothetical protein
MSKVFAGCGRSQSCNDCGSVSQGRRGGSRRG